MTLQGTGSKLLTLEDLYDPAAKVDFEGKPRYDWSWSGNNNYFGSPTDKVSGDHVWQIGSVEPEAAESLYDIDQLKSRIDAISSGPPEGGDGDDADHASHTEDDLAVVALSRDQTSILAIQSGRLYRYELALQTAVSLAKDVDSDAGATFSPDGRWVTYINQNTLHVVAPDQSSGKPVIAPEAPEILNGRLDWVYQEELYGRGNFNGYWWSPDSALLAFLRLDVSKVSTHTLASHEPSVSESVQHRYPRAGTPNPLPRLGVFDISTQKVRWIDFPEYHDVDHLIVNVHWSIDGETLSCQVQDREQTWLDLVSVDPVEGSHRTVLRETSPAWVRMTGPPRWLSDGSFVWISDRSGWSHLYHFDAQGTLIRPITSGNWDVRKLYGVQEEQGEKDGVLEWIYFSSTERGSLDLDTCRIRIDGSGFERLTADGGTHQARFAPDMAHFIDVWSSALSPAEVHLHRSDGTRIRELESCTAPEVTNYERGSTEHFGFAARDQTTLEAMMIKPPGFDPNRKYPVLCYVYGGPMTPVVRNAWGGPTSLWHHMLAQRGCIVWMVDNRASSAKGMGSVWPIYRNFGEIELQDLEDSIGWLKGQRYVDPDRIGIWGWSFGGYLTAYAMTHSQSFRAGIAGAPVTDWALYDTIYTERYMQTPEHNPEGYRNSSVLEAASNLKGKLLLVHGTADDNVHIEHTMRLVRELQREGKDFDLMMYPGAKHGIEDPAQLYDLRRRMTAFITENL